jgi:isopentenyl diphosphate isomerase/L-lactate dehydrogenase-like FMN-dependent dehydrogenase
VGSLASRLAAAAAAAAAGSPQATAAVSSQQSLLSEANMQQYVQRNEQLCNLLRGSEELQVQQLLDGVINMVWRGRWHTDETAC